MTIMHVVLQKLDKSMEAAAQEAFIGDWCAQARSLKGKIPGLLSMHAGPCLPGTEDKAKGFDVILVCTLQDETALSTYGSHPLHEALKAAAKGKYNDNEKIIYDFTI